MGIHLNTRNPKEPHDYSGHIELHLPFTGRSAEQEAFL